MAKSWVGHNNKAFKKAMNEKKAELEKRVLGVLTFVARQIFEGVADTTYNQGDGYMPYFTGNLRDSTGLGIYYNGALDTLIPPKNAEQPQNYFQVGHWEFDIWGFQFIREALDATSDFNKGIWVALYSTAPYAKYTDDNGTIKYWDAGWFSENIVQRRMLPMFKTAFAREFPNIARQLTII